jgi:hypothetical protein
VHHKNYYLIVLGTLFLNLFNHFNICILTLPLHIYNIKSNWSIFICWMPYLGWPKKAETCSRITTCLYIIASNYNAVIEIYIVAQNKISYVSIRTSYTSYTWSIQLSTSRPTIRAPDTLVNNSGKSVRYSCSDLLQVVTGIPHFNYTIKILYMLSPIYCRQSALIKQASAPCNLCGKTHTGFRNKDVQVRGLRNYDVWQLREIFENKFKLTISTTNN